MLLALLNEGMSRTGVSFSKLINFIVARPIVAIQQGVLGFWGFGVFVGRLIVTMATVLMLFFRHSESFLSPF